MSGLLSGISWVLCLTSCNQSRIQELSDGYTVGSSVVPSGVVLLVWGGLLHLSHCVVVSLVSGLLCLCLRKSSLHCNLVFIWAIFRCHVMLPFFSCDQAALWMVFSVCPSVCHTFFTMFPSSYRHEIFRSYYQWLKWCPCKRSRSEVKGQGHRGNNPT